MLGLVSIWNGGFHLLSIVAGATVAVIYFLTSAFFSRWALEKSSGLAQVIVLGGFLARLTLFSVIFYLLWKLFQVEITGCLIAFVVAYTLFLPITVRVLAKNSSGQDILFSTRR